MKRRVLMFKPRFAPLVVADEKLHTLRPLPKVMPIEGTVLDMRMWEGRPYWSKQVRLCERKCSCIGRHRMDIADRRMFILTAYPSGMVWEDRNERSIEKFARGDGFKNAAEMWEWFENEHGRVMIEAIAIYWKPGAKS